MRVLIAIVVSTVLISVIVGTIGVSNRHPVVTFEDQLSSAQDINKELEAEISNPVNTENNTINTTNVSALQSKYPVDYIIADSDRRLITDEELKGKDIDFYRLARCEILARRGYKFKTPELNQYFEDKIWYLVIPSNSRITDISDLDLNDIEKSNLEKLSQYEIEFYKSTSIQQPETE